MQRPSYPPAGQNIAVQIVRELARHPTTGPILRYGIAGATVAVVYLGIPWVFNANLGVPIQIVIPIAYVAAISLHFTLQRHFVFRHVEQFALTRREQAARYVAFGVVQYPTTALATALLPHLLHISAWGAFVGITLAVSGTFFLILRRHVFHPTHQAGDAG